MKTRLIFIRHAEAEGNYKRIFHGWTDSEITERGHIQAKKVAERLKNVDIDVIYSSSLKRTLQTAEYIAAEKGLAIIRTDKLKEINGGDWEGEEWSILPEKWPYEYDTWENKPHIHKMPNGESIEEMQKRVVKEVKYIVSNNKGKNICIVTHGTAIKALMCYFYRCELEKMLTIPWYDNTAVTIVDYEDDEFKILLEGDASHLGKEDSTIENQNWWKEFQRKINKIKGEG
ncbi:MAG: histidine phosphatase family protein [Acetivibrionales bacterium]|jgi:broad specificity phosphatase PhoE